MPTNDHGLNTPQKGAKDWHEPLNQNFRDIDTLLHRISQDGTTYSPDAVETDEISLGGSSRSEWPGGGEGAAFSTDPTTATNDVIVAQDAEDIQTAIDTLDGTKTGYEGGSASRPGGGVVMLKRDLYVPDEPITMRNGVRIVGVQPDAVLGRNNHEWQYSVISGRNLSSGEPIVEYPNSGQHAGLHNLVVSGAGEDVHGVKINAGFGATYHSNVVITRCHGSGFWTRGSLDTWLRDVSCKDNGTPAGQNSMGHDAPAVRLESEDDTVGQGGDDTQIRWYGGRISSHGPVPAVEASSSLHRFYDCTLKQPNEPKSQTAVVDFSGPGSLLELMRCTIDGYRSSNSIGILRGNNQLRLADSLVEKCGTGLAGAGNGQNMIANTKFRDFAKDGIRFGSRSALISNVDVRGAAGDGIVVDGANIKMPWTNVQVSGNGGYGIRITGVKGGKPGDVPVIHNLHAIGNGEGETNAPELLVVDGKWRKPYTYGLSGSDTLSLSEKPADPLDVRVDPNGGATLEGFDGPTRDGKVVVAEHAGNGTLTLAHDAGASNPLYNKSGSNEALDANGQVVAYRYDGQNGRWLECWKHAA